MNYVGFGPEKGHVVPEDKAYAYALGRCLHGTTQDQEDFRKMLVRCPSDRIQDGVAFREMLVEWFYSGNWIKEDEDDDVPL